MARSLLTISPLAWPEMNTTGMAAVAGSFWICPYAVGPYTPGMETSKMSRLGRSSWTFKTAWDPSLTATTWKPSFSKWPLSSSLPAASSSAIRISSLMVRPPHRARLFLQDRRVRQMGGLAAPDQHVEQALRGQGAHLCARLERGAGQVRDQH